jgi:hypothetical protein
VSDYCIDNAKGRLLPGVADLLNVGALGDWAFAPAEETPAIWIRTPDGTKNGTMSRLPLSANGWQWDGNCEAPSITPSIHRLPIDGYKPGWHGFMTAGELKSC